jgi:hypothetical protein
VGEIVGCLKFKFLLQPFGVGWLLLVVYFKVITWNITLLFKHFTEVFIARLELNYFMRDRQLREANVFWAEFFLPIWHDLQSIFYLWIISDIVKVNPPFLIKQDVSMIWHYFVSFMLMQLNDLRVIEFIPMLSVESDSSVVATVQCSSVQHNRE